MPISVEIALNGNNLKLPDVGPHDPPGSMTDYDPKHPKLIVFSCNNLDDGGIVYETRIDNQILLARGKIRLLTDDTDGVEIAAALRGTEAYVRDITTRHGLGRLTLRHYNHPQ